MPAKKSSKRVTVDINSINLDLDSSEVQEALGVPDDVWERMSDSEKVLLFTQRGYRNSLAALKADQMNEQ